MAISSSSNVTVQTGTLDGIGTVSQTATVPDGTGGIIANGSGGTGTFTINSLTFNGVGTMNLTADPVHASKPFAFSTHFNNDTRTKQLRLTHPLHIGSAEARIHLVPIRYFGPGHSRTLVLIPFPT